MNINENTSTNELADPIAINLEDFVTSAELLSAIKRIAITAEEKCHHVEVEGQPHVTLQIAASCRNLQACCNEINLVAALIPHLYAQNRTENLLQCLAALKIYIHNAPTSLQESFTEIVSRMPGQPVLTPADLVRHWQD